MIFHENSPRLLIKPIGRSFAPVKFHVVAEEQLGQDKPRFGVGQILAETLFWGCVSFLYVEQSSWKRP